MLIPTVQIAILEIEIGNKKVGQKIWHRVWDRRSVALRMGLKENLEKEPLHQ